MHPVTEIAAQESRGIEVRLPADDFRQPDYHTEKEQADPYTGLERVY